MTRMNLAAFAVAALALLLPAVFARADEASAPVELFADSFSRFPPGPLTAPLGKLNGAIQEYHYLPNRGVDLRPWANAICHIDAWVAGEEGGRPYVEQHLPPTHQDMVPKYFAPIFLTGEPEWRDYTVEVAVCPLSTADFAGVAFRYHTNRHHYVFSISDGKRARLAMRLPLEEKFRECAWKELAVAEFPYETHRYYKLRVENYGPEIRCFVDGKHVFSADDEEILAGKAGLTANAPARFRDFCVTVRTDTRDQIATAVEQREKELAKRQAANPGMRVWKKFETPKFGAGRNVRFGDLDGDGVLDMLIGQNVPKVSGDAAVEISCLTAVTLEGKVLWQMGRPDPRNGLLTCDTPFQIHDLDGDGKNEVVLTKDFQLQVLDGGTGKLKKSVPLPKIEGYPDVPQRGPQSWPHERLNGDSIAFINVTDDPARREIVLKDRYWNFWVFDRGLKLLWKGDGMLGHYPFAYDDGKGERDHLAIGYSLWSAEGQRLWTNDERMHQHADSIFVGNLTDDPAAAPMAFYCGSDDGVIMVDDRGVIRRQYRVGHAQTAAVGQFRPELPGLEYATVNFWRNPGIVSIFDARGNLLQQEEPIHSGCPMLPVNWSGDGEELILLSGNVDEGGMVDGRLRRTVMFPDDGHPDLCAAVHNLTGDARDEIGLWNQDEVWIYTQDQPFMGDKMYAPTRNPLYNDSNYRISVSRPGWSAAPPKK